ncbi:MAG TPA: DUF397 domain-containing protein [Trebonia sp.]|nr:DUF397 domain-containing protein [Trebonia sp.]
MGPVRGSMSAARSGSIGGRVTDRELSCGGRRRRAGSRVVVRDTTNRAGGALAFPAVAWQSLLAEVRAGRYLAWPAGSLG